MKKVLFKNALMLSVAAVMLITTVACGSSNKNSKMKSSSEAVSSNTASSGKQIKLKMIEHTNQATNDAIKALNDKFTKKYPNVTIESTVVGTSQLTQLKQTRIAANDVDILEFSTFGITNPDWAKGLDKNANVQYIENGDILDLTGQPFIKNWDPIAIKDACSYNGKVYSLNIGKAATNGIFYNKKLFDQYGLKVPDSWNEFINICKTLKAKGIAPLTGGGKDVWPLTMMWYAIINADEPDLDAFAKGLWTGERKFNDPKTLKLFEKMAELASYYEEGVSSIDYASVVGRFIAGKAAMLPDGTWEAAQISAADPNFKYGYFAIPGETKGNQLAQLAGKYDIGYAGYAKSSYKTEILQWFEFFSQKENYNEFINTIGFIPVMPGVTIENEFIKSLEPLNKNFQVSSSYFVKNPKGLGKYGGFQINQLKVLGGPVATAKELADLAQKDWDAALAANK